MIIKEIQLINYVIVNYCKMYSVKMYNVKKILIYKMVKSLTLKYKEGLVLHLFLTGCRQNLYVKKVVSDLVY